MHHSLRLTIITLLLAVTNLPAATHYVSLTSTNPTPPYTNWVTAATNIQNAVDVALAGDEIVVTNGTYDNGSQYDRYITNGIFNRVVVDKPVTLRSVNGPQVTVILGSQPPISFLTGLRCVFLTNGAILSGFTLAGGSSGIGSFQDISTRTGGGVLCAGPGAIVSNCVLYGNAACDSGGGAQGGTLNNCTLRDNWALGKGGGADGVQYISGVCTLNNCKLTGNRAGSGGGACDATLNNCTLTGNSTTDSHLSGGGANNCTLQNCIVYYNTAANGPNYDPNCGLSYCCTTPAPPDETCFSDEPGFVDYAGGNLRLRPDSPCLGMGNLDYVVGSTDLDGRPRLDDGLVDLGAYEWSYQEFLDGITGEFIGWLEGYGLPTDGSADYADSDGDGHNNWQEWVCGTCPTNRLSALRLLSAAPTGTNVTLSWQSVSGVNYLLKRSTNLASSFTFVATNITGQAGTTTYADTNATGAGPFFYRVGVQSP